LRRGALDDDKLLDRLRRGRLDLLRPVVRPCLRWRFVGRRRSPRRFLRFQLADAAANLLDPASRG
jgi:hypothetical protein